MYHEDGEVDSFLRNQGDSLLILRKLRKEIIYPCLSRL